MVKDDYLTIFVAVYLRKADSYFFLKVVSVNIYSIFRFDILDKALISIT